MRPPLDPPCTIRSASFNNDIAAELLLELQRRYLPPPPSPPASRTSCST